MSISKERRDAIRREMDDPSVDFEPYDTTVRALLDMADERDRYRALLVEASHFNFGRDSDLRERIDAALEGKEWLDWNNNMIDHMESARGQSDGRQYQAGEDMDARVKRLEAKCERLEKINTKLRDRITRLQHRLHNAAECLDGGMPDDRQIQAATPPTEGEPYDLDPEVRSVMHRNRTRAYVRDDAPHTPQAPYRKKAMDSDAVLERAARQAHESLRHVHRALGTDAPHTPEQGGTQPELLTGRGDQRPKRGGWAPGFYANTCQSCGRSFVGDKWAWTCADCAYADTSSEQAHGDALAALDRLIYAAGRLDYQISDGDGTLSGDAETIRQALTASGVPEETESLRNDYHLLASEMVYEGNSVQHWCNKAKAYKDEIGKVWEALKENGIHPDGRTSCNEAVRKALAQPHSDSDVPYVPENRDE